MFPVEFLSNFSGANEPYVVHRPGDLELDRLHQRLVDPWGVDQRRYERRKRQVTMSSLPAERFRRVLEVGCSLGALAEDLATRCDELIAVDSSLAAVRAASERVSSAAHVTVVEASVPYDWPPGRSLSGCPT